MRLSEAIHKRAALRSILYAILFLVFFQLLSDFIESVYAFGLLKTSLTAEVGAVLLLLTPALLLLRRRPLPGWAVVVLAELVLACRVAESLLPTRGRMMLSGLGAGLAMLLLPSLFVRLREEHASEGGLQLGSGLLLAVALSALLRAAGSGIDLTNYAAFRTLSWSLALIAAILALGLGASASPAGPTAPPKHPAQGSRNSLGKTLALCLGVMAGLTLLYYAFLAPNVIARWTGADYPLIVGLLALGLALGGLLLARPQLLIKLPPWLLLSWNALFLLSLVGTILPHQLTFPAEPAGYPFFEPPVSWLSLASLVAMLLLSPVIFVDFSLYAKDLSASRTTPRSMAGGFLLGAFFMLVMIFAHVFTTVYDYIPVVGPLFRDQFWVIHLVVGLAASAPILLLRKSMLASKPTAKPYGSLVLVPLVAASAFATALLTAPSPTAEPPANRLTLLTYNIQQGYSELGQRNFEGQLQQIREIDADIIGLQESDTNRVSGGNADLVRYFADSLELYAYYGPKTVAGTFGIALLSKVPIQNPRTFYMYSQGEQTAAIQAQISVGGQTFNVFVTHLGNGGPIVQQRAVLQAVGTLPNVILMGDFNFEPTEEQYALTSGVLEDAWMIAGAQLAQPTFDSSDRIDHIFLSPGASVGAAAYIESPDSDHPAMLAEIEW